MAEELKKKYRRFELLMVSVLLITEFLGFYLSSKFDISPFGMIITIGATFTALHGFMQIKLGVSEFGDTSIFFYGTSAKNMGVLTILFALFLMILGIASFTYYK